MDYKSIEKINQVCKALGNPTRIKIAFGLSKKSYCDVNSMAESLNISQPGVSQHLNILKQAGVVEFFNKGQQHCYRLKKSKELSLLLKTLERLANEEE